MQKECVYLGIKSESFKPKDSEEVVAYHRVHVWDKKSQSPCTYPISGKAKESAESEQVKFGDEIVLNLEEAIKRDYKTGFETSVLKVVNW